MWRSASCPHCPRPTARLLLGCNKMRGRGAQGRLGGGEAYSGGQWLPVPQLALHPRPHFAGAPNFLPTHDPRSAHSAALRFPAAPVRKRTGHHACRGRGWWRGMGTRAAGHLFMVEPRLQTCPFKPGSTLRTLESFGTRSDVEPYPWSQPLSPSPTPKPSPNPSAQSERPTRTRQAQRRGVLCSDSQGSINRIMVIVTQALSEK